MVILAEADFLARTVQGPELQESANAVKAAGRIVAALSRELLGSTRKAAPTPERVDSPALMANCQQLLLRMLAPSTCTFDVDRELWPVSVQPQQLEAALLNLAANARDAMPGGGSARISARNFPRGAALPPELPPGDYVMFSLEDSGEGMSSEVLAKATEAFFTTKGHHQGTGLGLAMVKAFATQSGGALQIQSKPGHGTLVAIVLPRAARGIEPFDARDSRYPTLVKLSKRLRASPFLDVLNAWAAACPSNGLPTATSLEVATREHAARTLVIAIDGGRGRATFRLSRMGHELVRALDVAGGQQLGLNGPEFFASLEMAYRRAMSARCPNYQRVRYSFGGEASSQLERLILPAAVDERAVTHLFGIIVLSSSLTERDHEH